MAVVAVLVFVAAYILIATERVPKMVTALVGAGIILGLGVASAEEVFYSHETGVDWDVIFRVGRSIWRRSKPHTRWEGCASRARWPRQSCSLPPIKRPSSPAQYFPLTGDFWRSRRARSSFALTATGQAIDQRQRLSCSAAATRCLLPHRRSCLAAPRSARVRYPRSN